MTFPRETCANKANYLFDYQQDAYSHWFKISFLEFAQLFPHIWQHLDDSKLA